MKVEIKKALSLGERAFTAPVLVYENLEELTKAAKDPNLIVSRLNSFLHAHGSAADLRELVFDVTEEFSKVAPIQKPTGKKKDGQELTKQEDALPYVTRVLGAKPELFDKIQLEVTRRAKGYKATDENGKEVVVPALSVDITMAVRTSGGVKKLATKLAAVALSFLKGEKNLDKFNKASAQYGIAPFVVDKTVPATDEKNVQALGWVLKAYNSARESFDNM